MTAEQWWDEVGCDKFTETSIGTQDIARLAFAAGQANAPQPQWRRWEDEKPQVENEWGAVEVTMQFQCPIDGNAWCCAYKIATVILDGFGKSYIILGWQYILPSGFAPKQKDEAEVAFIKFDANEEMPRVSWGIFKQVYEFIESDRAKAKQ